jgi:hypothetical protein
MARNIPVSMDKELLADVDAVAGDRDETRSLVMRKAIQAGLPIVKTGSNADVLTLDGELSADVDKARKETGLARNKILIEAIRAGFHAFVSRVMSEKLSLADVQDRQEKEKLLQLIEESYKLYDEPMAREHRRLIVERGHATTRLMDILRHVPEARRRDDAAKRLTEIRRSPDGGGGGRAWGNGLSTDEMEWQIAMAEKYGNHAAKWPEELKKANSAWSDAMREKYGSNTSWPQDEVKAHYAELKAKML